MLEVSSCNLLYNGTHLIIIGLSVKQHQFRQKRLHESEPDRIRVYGDQKRHCPESQYSLHQEIGEEKIIHYNHGYMFYVGC